MHSRLVACNREMCEILRVASPDEVRGASIRDRSEMGANEPVWRFIEEGFRLIRWNYSPLPTNGRSRHFVIHAVGTWEGETLVSVLGSCTEVTEQVERERRMVSLLEEHEARIGRDLHDETSQILTSLRMLSNSLARRYFDEGDEGYTQAHQFADLARETQSSLQRIYRNLIPRRLETDTLWEALDALAFQANALPDVAVHFEGDEALRFRDADVKLQLYRIAQEALANAIKHAEASKIEIGLYREDQEVVLEVRDDGQGFDVAAAGESSESIRLYSMRYRAHSIKAVLQIESAPGAGTRVRCSLSAGMSVEGVDRRQDGQRKVSSTSGELRPDGRGK